MDKKRLYIGGGFDILHKDHKKFIILGIKFFKRKYGNLSKVIIGLKEDSYLNKQKGNNRPFFSYEWRKEDLSNFLKDLNVEHTIITSTDILSKFKGRKDIVAEVRSGYLESGKQIERLGISLLYVNPINKMNTSFFEKELLKAQNKSNCNLRKVGALLIRNGKVISKGYSGSGNCNKCPKYLAYKKGGGKLSKKVECKYDHAEVMVLKKARKGDDMLITNSPCKKCAELIISKGIRRVVYINEYYNKKPIRYLIKNGIKIRKSGV